MFKPQAAIVVPSVVTIAGDQTSLEFLDHCIQQLVPSARLCSRRVWLLWSEYVKDKHGNYLVEFYRPEELIALKKIFNRLGFTRVNVRYSCAQAAGQTSTNTDRGKRIIRYKGRAAGFDLAG